MILAYRCRRHFAGCRNMVPQRRWTCSECVRRRRCHVNCKSTRGAFYDDATRLERIELYRQRAARGEPVAR